MTDPLRVMPRPCDPSATSGACPFRRDADPGEFSAERFELLAASAGGPGREAPIGAPLFACHHTRDGAEVACAGWMAVCGDFHMSVRVSVVTGALDPSALHPGPDWPPLFDSYEQMAAAQSGERPYEPELADQRRAAAGHDLDMIDKIRRTAAGGEYCERR